MKKNLSFVIVVIVLSVLFVFIFLQIVNTTKKYSPKTETLSLKKVASEIMADGQIRSQNEALLHFSITGKVVYLPFKEGDIIKQGQTIASLDSYTTQKQLASTLNTYRTTRNTFDQTKDNIQDNVQKAQMLLPYDYYAKAGIGGLDTKENAMNDAVKRILDQNQANLDNSVIQVELTNYAFTLSTLTSPINGVLIHQDVSTPQVMITPQNTFTVIDPDAFIFRANVSENDINFIQEGDAATIQLNGNDNKINCTILKIYPDKISLPTGENVYQIDIGGAEIGAAGKYKQGGVVLIKNKYDTSVILVPSWLILSKQHIWILENEKIILKTIKTGETVGGNTEVLDGLSDLDKVISNPATLIKNKYPLL